MVSQFLASTADFGWKARTILRTSLVLAALSCATRSEAQQFGYRYYGWGGPDPYSYAPMPGAVPSAYSAYTWQTTPFAVGYNLLTGYQPIYSAARQPVGHELIWTGDNSYVYRPTYSPYQGSMRTTWWGGPLVIDFPGTDQAKYYTSSGPVWDLKPGMFKPDDVAPPLPPIVQLEPEAVAPAPRPAPHGPREF